MIDNIVKQISFLISTLRENIGNHYSFKLFGFGKGADGEDTVIYHIKGSHRNHIKKLKNSYDDDIFLSNFPPEDLKKIIFNFARESSNTTTQATTGGSSIGRCALPIAMCYFSLLLTAIILSPNQVVVGSLPEPGGILMFPLTYVVADIFSERYGYYAVRQVIWGAILALGTAALGSYLCLKLNHKPGWTHWKEYAFVFSFLPKLFYVNAIAILASDFLNAILFDKLRKLTHGSFLWLRMIGASGVGEISFTIIWITLFYQKSVFDYESISFMMSNYAFKMVYTAAFIPLSYFAVHFIKKIDEYELSSHNSKSLMEKLFYLPNEILRIILWKNK